MTEKKAPETIWLMRLGEEGRYESTSLERGIALIGFQSFSDMTGMTEEQIGEMVEEKATDEAAKGMDKSQLRMFARRMQIGDGIVADLHKTPGKVAIGRISGDYEYRVSGGDEMAGQQRHLRPIEWFVTSMDKKDLGDHLRAFYTARSTVRPIRNTEADQRIRDLMSGTNSDLAVSSQQVAADDEGTVVPVVQEISHAEIARRIHERFPAEKLERLIAALLEADGYVVQQSRKGADQGVDVLAGHGPMGFDSPRICVQVKHTNSPIGAPDVQKLRGAMQDFNAEQGLFVSWSDYTSDAQNEARRHFFTLRLWNANDVIEAVCRNYDKLPEEIRTEIPLQRIWTLVPDDDL